IKQHFPTLSEIIDRRHPEEEKGKPAPKPAPEGRPGQQNAPPVQMGGTVGWDEADLLSLQARFQWKAVPSTLEVLLAQEDLWVYEALLRVVRNTNNTSGDPANYVKPVNRKMAGVKRIIAMQIGQDAVNSWQASDQTVIRMAANAPGGAAPAPAKNAGMSPHIVPGVDTHQPGRPQSLAGRYVDDQGRPLADPAQQPYAEFRMMPINLRVVIEQNQIPKLLAECANSNMPIEVRKVRILAEEFPPFDPGEAGGTTTTGIEPGYKPHGGPGPAHPGAGPVPGPGGTPNAVTGGQDEECVNPMIPPVPLEVQGIIYIYNPPNRENLGKGTAGGAVAPGGGPAGPTPPGPTPPAPGTPPGPKLPAAPGVVPPGPPGPAKIPTPGVSEVQGAAKPAPAPGNPGQAPSPTPPPGPPATPLPPGGQP
ncbi:MAG: hypothetical protein ABR915_03055, partial [Thermoguttaceae bacterium]